MINALGKIEDSMRLLWDKIKLLFEWIPKTTMSIGVITVFLLSVYSEHLAKAFAAIGTISAVIWALLSSGNKVS
ncbi:MAG: hypothetical protein ACYDIC_09955 [Desulfobaccales bacterium]